MKLGKGQKGSSPHMAWWWSEPFRCQLLEEVLASGNLLLLHSGFIWDSGSVISVGYSLFLTNSDSLQGSKCPVMEYLLRSGTRQTSQLVMPPTHSRTDGPPYRPYNTYCWAWPSYRYFSAFQVPLVSVLKHQYGNGIQAVLL